MCVTKTVYYLDGIILSHQYRRQMPHIIFLFICNNWKGSMPFGAQISKHFETLWYKLRIRAACEMLLVHSLFFLDDTSIIPHEPIDPIDPHSWPHGPWTAWLWKQTQRNSQPPSITLKCMERHMRKRQVCSHRKQNFNEQYRQVWLFDGLRIFGAYRLL